MRRQLFVLWTLIFIGVTGAQGWSQDDVFLDDLPEDVLATMEARDKAFAGGDIEGLGDEFFYSDLQAWPQNQTVTVAFLGGDNQLHADIADATAQITDGCNLSFDFGHNASTGTYRTWTTSDTTYAADIRVSFDQSGFFSLVGRDSVTPFIGRPTGPVGGRPHQRSLNLGRFNIQRPADWQKVVRHEFLHAIAFKHEHQSPLGGCDAQFRWQDDPGYSFTQDARGRFITDPAGKRPGIYTYLSGAPNFWSRGKVDHNLRQLPASSGTAGPFDRESIMLYRFPPLFYASSPSPCAPTGAGNDLSAGDLVGLQQLYPIVPDESSLLSKRQVAFEMAAVKALAVAAAAPAESLIKSGSSGQPSMLPATIKAVSDPGGQDSPRGPTEQELIDDKLRAYRAKLYYEDGGMVSKTTGPKIVYGDDNRIDILRLGVDAMERQLAASTCLLTSKSRVASAADHSILTLRDYRFSRLPPCGNERFKEQKLGGWCSGFLVGPDLVCTAGHCCEATDENVQGIAFIFGFYASDQPGQPADADPTATPSALNQNQVYFGKRVVSHRLSSAGDFAIIQLDRAVTFPGAATLEVSLDLPANGQRIGMIGHPSGLPAKAAFGAETKIFDVQPTWLKTNLDAYGGNSGSAVFDSAGKVIGILVRGNQDFRIHNNQCFFTNKVSESQSGEMVTRASVFRDQIPMPVPDPNTQ